MGDRDPGLEQKNRKRKFIHFADVILFENDNVIVVNKPAGLSSLEDRTEKSANLQQLAQKYHAGASLCHRLDKWIPGVLVIAKNQHAYREISMQLERRETTKRYLALIHGAREFQDFEINAPLIASKSGMVYVNPQQGTESVTMVNTVRKFRNHSLVECKPIIGRTHQIRAHLTMMNSPIIGDTLYGGADLLLSDLKLPGETEMRTFAATLPENFEMALKILEKYDH